MDNFLGTWYNWGIFLGIFLAVAAAIYVFFDSKQLADPEEGKISLIVSVVGALMTLPSLYYELTIVRPAAGNDLLAILQTMTQLDTLISMMYLALLGVAIAFMGLAYYMLQVKQSANNINVMPTQTQYASTMNSGPVTSPAPPLVPVTPPPPPPSTRPPSIASEPRPRPANATRPLNIEPDARAWLVIQKGSRSGSQYGLRTQSFNTIGRDPKGADLVIDDDTVSREHARVRYENGRFVIYDLASTSGTYVNGNLIQRQMLYDADRISVGSAQLIFKST